MGAFDIIILALFALFFLVGFLKGFTKQLWSLIILVLAIVGAIFLSAPLTGLVRGTGFFDTIQGWLSGLTNGSDIAGSELFELTEGGGLYVLVDGVAVELAEALTTFKIPGFLADFVVANAEAGMVLGDAVVYWSATMILTVVMGAVIFLGIIIVGNIIKFIILGKPKTKPQLLNRLLGGALRCVYAFLFISVLMSIVGFFGKVGLGSAIEKWIVGEGETIANPIANWFYQGAWFEKIWGFVMSMIPGK